MCHYIKIIIIEIDVLKFEYLTQLLLDSNYIPLILKLLQSQELDQVVSYRCDKDELRYCGSK